MKKIILLFVLAVATGSVFAQRKTTSSASVTFDATTPKDPLVTAVNKTVVASLNTQTGDIAFEAGVANFAFTNPELQEHFNGAKWMNSAQYPKFTFTGKITNLSKIKFNKNGGYKASVDGKLTVRDVTKPVKVNGTVTVKDGKITLFSDFKIKLADYNISGQPLESGKVRREPQIKVTAEF